MTDETRSPDPVASDVLNADLYADLIQFGGLAAAMRQVSHDNGIDLGDIRTDAGRGLFNSADLSSARGPISIRLGAAVRKFSITLGSGTGNYIWANGGTEDLFKLVEMADAWRGGAVLRDLDSRFPFMKYGRLSQGYEDGNPVAVQWDILLGGRDEYITDLPLLRAAHSNGRLRGLFPYYSHGVLNLARDCNDRTAGRIEIGRMPSGSYRITSTVSNEGIFEAPTMEEAIDRASSLVGLELD